MELSKIQPGARGAMSTFGMLNVSSRHVETVVLMSKGEKNRDENINKLRVSEH